ncbi:peptide ABC transporter substrate-binding protein [Ruania rhizosphaerae]|uniref:peptide ABC transporter substrate-binding protein n=1 Tax=Ruania rhizosphaerae TaxID=1840413 RepID=UPI001358C454|nr:ABC transporter substrate-binding protein [Ruania rhizosphaerae]
MPRSLASRPRSAVLIATVAATALTLSSCGGSAEDSSSDIEPVVVATTEGAMTDMTPGMSQGSNVDYALFTPLTKYDASSGDVENAVAESIESEDQVHWTITLEEGWTFHDGSPVTAQSFADSWNLAADPANAMDNNGQMVIFEGYDELNPVEGEPTATELSGVEVVDDLTLEVTLTEPNQLLPYRLSSTAFSPITEETAADPAEFARAPIGNGPFMVEEGWELGAQDVTLTRFEDYSGDAAGLEQIQLRIYQDPSSTYTDFQSGQVDVALIEANDLTAAEENSSGEVVEVTLPALIYLGFPTWDDRFADVDVRTAIATAIDRDAIVDQLLEGHGTAATGLSPDVLAGADQVDCPTCVYDPEGAADLLESAGGWDGPLELQTYADPVNEMVLQAIANQLSDNLGIDATMSTAPIGQVYDNLRAEESDGPFLLYSGAAYPHVYAQANALMATTGGLNMTKFSDPAFDEALSGAKAAADLEQAAQQAADAAEIGLAEAPITPIFYPSAGIVHSEGLTNIQAELLGGVNIAAIERG